MLTGFRRFHRIGLALLGALAAGLAAAQAPPPVRLTQAIDNARLVRLHGNVHRLAQPGFDRGVAPANLALHGMMLLLQPSPAQQTALQQLLQDQHTPGSAQYRHWLTPSQFGAEFGPAPADLQTTEQWLRTQGFRVDRVARGGNVIEFSGTAGAVAAGFHTSLHRYEVAGVQHWANATDPAIPAALAPVVAGVVSLNDFVKPGGHVRGIGHGSKPVLGAGEARLAYTPANGQPEAHVIAPGDFAILYNAAPLYSANINGQGEAIAIVGRSDVEMSDIQDFRTLFVPSNPGNLPQVFVNGPDPGDVGGGDEGESDLDLEWAGAVAPNATIDFVVSATTDTTDGVDLSAEYIVDNNLAPVMSTSFDACEADLGSSENQFIASLYEQAAAQGITVVDSSGDSGAAACDPNDGSEAAATQGLGVSGLASTPYDTAVGGTQFNEGSGSYWNSSNNVSTLASAETQIPETAWNESCLTSACDPNAPLSASGGGQSQNYSKPPWQQAPGVPGDSVRDVPDVAFSAADHDGYVVCQGGICHPDSSGNFNFDVFAGTSASAPAFAGVMALVNQKTSSIQGVANNVLYGLARAETWSQCNSATGTSSSLANCVFLDTTNGNNSVPCAGGSPGCSSSTSGSTGTLTGFAAGVGYDLATGLGSINVANLVNNWASATPSALSITTLTLSPTTAAHGQNVAITITVTSANGLPGPTGDVSLIAQTSSAPNSVGVDFGTLQPPTSCANDKPCLVGTENALPGGSYSVVARYAGDGNYAPSLSSPVAVNISPEGSATSIAAYEVDAYGNEVAVSGATYGDLVFLDSEVVGAASATVYDGVPSGSVSFTNNGAAFAPPGFSAGALALNTEGAADFPNGVTTLVPGTYALVAAYSGDNSFTPSTSASLSLSVSQAPATTSVNTQVNGASEVLTANVTTSSLGNPPSGNVTFYAGTTALGTSPVSGSNDPNTGIAGATATLTVTAAQVGQGTVTAAYSGDANYFASAPVNLTVNPTAASVALGAGTTLQIGLAPVNGFSGAVTLQCGGVPYFATCAIAPTSVTLSGSSPGTATVTITTSASALAPPPARPGPDARWWWLAAMLGLAAMGLCLRRRRLVPLAVVLGLALGGAACGGGSPSSSTGGNSTVNLAGTYQLTITATANGATAQVPFDLTVQ